MTPEQRLEEWEELEETYWDHDHAKVMIEWRYDDINQPLGTGDCISIKDLIIEEKQTIAARKDANMPVSTTVVEPVITSTEKKKLEICPDKETAIAMTNIEDWVWFYYDKGFSIIPLGVNTKNNLKAPSIDTWEKYHQQQPTKEEIQTWIDNGLFKNIGVICGEVSNNLVVIDIDDEKIPKDIGLNLDKIAETGAWIVKTGKGYHIYCKHHSNPGGIKKPLKYKIEYRANRGYVVAPPGIHPNGSQYHFLGIDKKEDLTQLQEKDVKNIFNDMKEQVGKAWNIKPPDVKKQTPTVNDKEKSRGYPRCVEIALNKTTKPSMRYYTTYGIASSFAMNGIPKEMAMKRIKQYNMEKCTPPHENHIIEQAVNGAYKEDAKRYGCEFWIDQAETCPYENIDDCYYGHKKLKRELAQKYKIYKYSEKKNKDGEKYHVKTGVIYPNLAELILNEYDYNFLTTTDTKEIFYYNYGFFHSKGENPIRSISEEYMEKLSSKHGKNEVDDHIRDKNYQDRDIFNAPKHLIPLKNGIYNLNTGELLPHNPKNYFLNCIPVEYNKDADCPVVKKFLSEIVEEKDIDAIEEFIGYCLYRDYPFHRAAMFLGAGKNGKSKCISLIKALVGKENVSNKELQEIADDRFATSKLYGKLLNSAADLSSEALHQTGKFKALTGQDTIDAQKKFKDSFNFENYAKLLYSANALPKTEDDSYAFYRRWLLFTFPNTFEGENCDPHILDKLTTPEELSGLFNLGIKGLKRLLKNNGFSYSKTVEQTRDQYKTLSDPIYSFCQEFISTDTTGYLLKADVYEKYLNWCKEKDVPPNPLNMFSQDLNKHIPNMRISKKRINGRQEPAYLFICWKIDDSNGQPGTPAQQEVF
jgi:putative DNA primase/helicase